MHIEMDDMDPRIPGSVETDAAEGQDDGLVNRHKYENKRKAVLRVAILIMIIAMTVVGIYLAFVLRPRKSPTKEPPPSSFILKGLYDNRDYRYVTLDNGLGVLLVSDPKADKAAASVSVGVGSEDGPKEVPGLAHFLEHMLFMGSSKYPNEAEYSEYISSHGGITNAYTADQMTVYYFTVQAQDFRSSLDRFSQFFIAPLLDPNSIGREMNAVHSEYEKDIPDDDWRIQEIVRFLSNPASRYNHFSIGSFDTLNRTDIRTQLNNFYKTYYTAPQMKVVLLGKESLDDLKNMATELFINVPKQAAPEQKPSPPPFSPSSAYLSKIVYMKPNVPNHRVVLVWPARELYSQYLMDIPTFLDQALGTRYPGSLKSILEENGWIQTLSISTDLSKDLSLISIDITLTEDGYNQLDSLIAIVYQAIRNIKDKSTCDTWSELVKKYLSLNFNFSDPKATEDFISETAANLQYVAPRDVLGSPQYYSCDINIIKEVLGTMVPGQSMTIILSPNVTNNLPYTEPYFNIQYIDHPISTQQINKWTTDVIDKLRLPPTNAYWPTKFEVYPNAALSTSSDPQLVIDEKNVKAYHSFSAYFPIPKAGFSCSMESLVLRQQPEYLYLFIELVKDKMEEESFSINQAGMDYKISVKFSKLLLELYGFYDKLRNLAFRVTQVMRSSIREERFETIKSKVITKLTNKQMDSPYLYLIKTVRPFVTLNTEIEIDQLIARVKNANVTGLKDFQLSFLNSFNLDCYGLGNLLPAEVKSLALVMGVSEHVANDVPFPGSLLFPVGNSVIKLKAPNQADPNSAVLILYELALPSTIKDIVTLEVLGMWMEQPCFDQLRSKEQLGYIVACLVNTLYTRKYNLAQLIVIVQSTLDPNKVADRADKFIRSFASSLDSKSLQLAKNALKNKKLQQPTSLKEEMEPLFNEVIQNTYVFDRLRKEAAQVEMVTLKDVEDCHSTVLTVQTTRRVLTIELVGSSTNTSTEWTDLSKWKEQQKDWIS